MSKFTIYDKDGNVRHESITEYASDGREVWTDSLEYSGSWMGECFVTLNIKSAYPIDFHIGDYVTYRDEKFVINYDPSVIKKARRGTYGDGFTYDGIKFNALQTELTDIMFYDYVLYDNNLHYTSLPVFPFYAKDIDDYCDRLQANTNRYCKDNNFQMSDYWLFITPTCDSNNVPVRTIQRAQTFGMSSGEATARWQAIYGADGSGVSTDDMKGDVAVNISNDTVWNALARIKNDFGLNFITRGREVIVGSAGLPTNHVFKYGSGEGLYELERVADSEQQVITKLWAYGSDKNMPIRYYANLTKLAYVSGTKEERTGQGYTEYWIRTSIPFADIKPALLREDTLCTLKYGNLTCQAVMDPEGGPTVIRLLHESGSSADQMLYNTYVNGDKIYVTAGVDIDKWPNSEYTGGGLPNNMAVNRLMLPGFPLQSLYDWVLDNDGEAVLDDDDNPIVISEGGVDIQGLATWHGYTAWFSCDRTRPFIVSQNYSELGIREASKYFDGSGDEDEIYPSIENAPNDADKITSADMITDNGVFGESDDASVPMFSVTLPNISNDFKLDEQIEIGKARGESPVIAMKDGYCGGRELKIDSVTRNGDGTWTCRCEREHDDLLDLYFPYSYHVSIGQGAMADEPYQICAGDKYVLTGIPMTKTYIDFGAERLLEAALLFLSKNDYVRYTYLPKVDEIFMARQHQAYIDDPATTTRSLYLTIKEGDIMLFEDADLLIDGSVFIDTLQIRENGNASIPTFEVTLRDDKEVGTIQRTQEQISSSVSVNGVGGSSSGSGGGGGVNTNQIKNLIEAYGKEFFLSKLVDDTANGLITFVKGLVSKADLVVEGNGWFKKMLTAVTAKIDTLYSSNFTGWGVADAGYQLTNDYNGTGKSGLVVDYIYARMKLVAEALELKKYEVSAGDQMYSMAANYINRTEYLTDEDVSVGWSEEKVPWLLRGMPLTLRKTLTGNQVFGIFARKRKIRMHIENTDVRNIAKVRCYFLAKDGDRDVENWWRVGDLARCQTLNVVSSRRDDYVSVERKAGNVFWWRKVIGVSTNDGAITWKNKETGDIKTQQQYEALTDEQKEQYIRNYNGTKTQEGEEHSGLPVMIDGKEYHWIDIAYDYDLEHAGTGGAETEWSGAAILSDIPCAGDTAVQFGNDGDPNRMNLMTLELNGLMNADAPCIKIYKGIYTYDLNKCWWGGKARKMLLSPSTGYEFYGPSFKFVQEYGIARVPTNRGTWYSIPFHRDEYDRSGSRPISYSDDSTSGRQSGYVRECYYYDQVTHNGSLWLCVASSLETGDGAHWVKPQVFDDVDYALFDSNGNYRFNGDYISNSDYNALSESYKIQCGRIPNYIVSEPSDNNPDWQKQVEKGEDGEDGENVVRLALDNEHEDFLYSESQTLPIAPSGGAKSVIRLYDGENEVTLSTSMLSIDASSSGVPTTGDYAPSIITDTDSKIKLKVPHITADTAKVVVKAMYNGNPYYAEFTGNKTSQDKYDLILAPSSIAYNSSSYSPVTINASAKRTDLQGTQTSVTINTSPDTGNVRLFIAKVNSNGTMTSIARLEAASYTVTQQDCANYIGIYIELRYYYDSSTHDDGLPSTYRVCDYETVEIAKAENGASAADYYTLRLNPATINLADVDNNTYIGFSIWKNEAGGNVTEVTSAMRTSESLKVYAKIKKTSSGSPAWYTVNDDVWAFAFNHTYAELTPIVNFELRKYSGNTYVVLDTQDVIVVKDGAPGAQGDGGYSLIVNPEYAVFEEVTSGNSKTVDTSGFSAFVQVRKGSVLQKVMLTPNTSITVLNCTASVVTTPSSDTKSLTATFTQINVNQQSQSNSHYKQGYMRFSISTTADGTTPDGNFTYLVEIPFYCNLVGTWSEEIKDGVKTEIAEDFDIQGCDTIEEVGEYIKSYAENTSTLSERVSNIAAQIPNMFGFNRGCVFTNCAPFIQGYGILTKTGQATVSNLGMNGNGGWFAVRCLLMLATGSTSYASIKLNGVAPTYSTSSLDNKAVTGIKQSGWTEFVGIYNIESSEDIGATNVSGDLNGYLSIAECDSSGTTVSSHRIYVRHLKVARGNVRPMFSKADEDTDGEATLLLGATDWDFASSTYWNNAESSKPEGSNEQTGRNWGGMSSSEMFGTDDYRNFIYKQDAIDLKKNTIYTLSFWAKTSKDAQYITESTFAMYLYKGNPSTNIIDDANGAIYFPYSYMAVDVGTLNTESDYSRLSEGVCSDGYTRLELTTQWRQYYVYWFVDKNISGASCIAYRLLKNLYYQQVTYMNDVRLYEGYVGTPNNVEYSTVFKQTARQIGMSVMKNGLLKSGINIDEEKIDLISGRVNFKNPDGTTNAKISIDTQEGTLYAENAEFVNGNFSGQLTVKRLVHAKKYVAADISLPGTDEENLVDTYICIGTSDITVYLTGLQNASYECIELTFINTSSYRVKLSGNYFNYMMISSNQLVPYYNAGPIYIPAQSPPVKLQLVKNDLSGWGWTWYVISGIVRSS